MTVVMAKVRRFSFIVGTSECGFETSCSETRFSDRQKKTFLSNHEEYFTLSSENKEIVSEQD
jgi:hypothetical protein